MATLLSSDSPIDTPTVLPPPLPADYQNVGKVGFVEKVTTAIRVVVMQIERMWVLAWVLPRTYQTVKRSGMKG